MKIFEVFLPSDHDEIDLWSLAEEPHPFTVEGKVIPVLIDTVYSSESVTGEEMEHALINHDGYPDAIWVVEVT